MFHRHAVSPGEEVPAHLVTGSAIRAPVLSYVRPQVNHVRRRLVGHYGDVP